MKYPFKELEKIKNRVEKAAKTLDKIRKDLKLDKKVYTAAHAGKLIAQKLQEENNKKIAIEFGKGLARKLQKEEFEELENQQLRDLARDRLKQRHNAVSVNLEEENETLRTMLRRMKERLELDYKTALNEPDLCSHKTAAYVNKLDSDISILKSILGEE